MTVEERLAALEKSNVRLRWLTVGALVLAVASGLLAWVRGPSSHPRVTALSVVDATGKERLTLGAHGAGYGLVVKDSEGRPRALLGTSNEGSPQLKFASTEGDTVAELLVYG